MGDRWFDSFFPAAHATGQQLAANSSTAARLRWMAQSWLGWLYTQDCPPFAENIDCPDADQLTQFNESVQNGWIGWHAVPFNTETALMTSGALGASVELTHGLDAHMGVPNKTVMSVRDVPFLTRSAIPQLRAAGVDTVSVGVNGGSRPPNLPKAFTWVDTASSTSVRVLLLQGGYGGLHGIGPAPISWLFDPVIVPGLGTVMVVDWAGDNSPPKSPADLITDWAHLQEQFPNASIVAGTFEDFAAELRTVPDEALPRITSEVAETWIFGAGADIMRTAMLRAAFRSLKACKDAGECSPHDPVVRNATGWMVRAAEHTDGLDHKSTITPTSALHANYSNAEFHALATAQPGADPGLVAKYSRLATSWTRQRAWSVGYALQAAESGPDGPAHPLARRLQSAFAELMPVDPRPASPAPGCGGSSEACLGNGSTFVPAAEMQGRLWRLEAAGVSPVMIGFNSSSGAVTTLAASGGAVWVNASESPGTELAALQYMTMGWEDYEEYEALYNYVSVINDIIGPTTGGVDFDDQALYGISAANASHRLVAPVLEGVWVEAGNASGPSAASRLVLQMHMPHDVVAEAGAFETVLVSVQAEAGATGATSLALTVTGFNKTSTRLPEALFLRFRPQLQQGQQPEPGSHSSRRLGVGAASAGAALREAAGEFASKVRHLPAVKARIIAAETYRLQAKAIRHRLGSAAAPVELGSRGDAKTGAWCLNKLERWLSPWPIPWGGSTRLHAVSEAGVAFVPSMPTPDGSGWGNGSVVSAAITSDKPDACANALSPPGNDEALQALHVASLDAAVVCVGDETALPIPTTTAPELGSGVSFLLHTNAWATNYAAFLGNPMPAGGPVETDFAWRFVITL